MLEPQQVIVDLLYYMWTKSHILKTHFLLHCRSVQVLITKCSNTVYVSVSCFLFLSVKYSHVYLQLFLFMPLLISCIIIPHATQVVGSQHGFSNNSHLKCKIANFFCQIIYPVITMTPNSTPQAVSPSFHMQQSNLEEVKWRTFFFGDTWS